MSNTNDLEYAGFWIRVGASIIDSILLIIITLPLTMMIYGDSTAQQNDSIVIIMGPADFLINWIFPAVAIIVFWLYKSATPGKMILGLKIVNADSGKPLSVGQAIIRYLGYYVATIPLLLGILWVGWDRRKQGWHDKLANTVVIKNNNLVDKVSFSN